MNLTTANSNKFPTVSVIIPVHNGEKYIGRCIRSVLKQSYPDSEYETIVINDASTDRTEYALSQLKDEILIINLENNLGLPGALNTGIRAARGRFIVRVDADDYVHEEYINVLSLHLAMNDYIDAIACDYQLVDNREHVIDTKNCLEEPIGCGIMFRIDQMIDLGLYDEDMRMHEDKDMLIRFLEKHEIHRVALPLYRYRRHDTNMTNKDEHMERYQEKLIDKHGDYKVLGMLKKMRE